MSRQASIQSQKARILPWVALAVYISTGFWSLWINRDVPIVRNAVLYSRIAYAHLPGDDVAPFSESSGYYKALGYPILSLPFIAKWGANVGIKASSFFWTSCWLLSVMVLYRQYAKKKIFGEATNASIFVALLVLCLNPLVFYQFLSGYPDTLDALCVLWALIFIDRFFSDDVRWYDGTLFCVSSLMAIWVKQHGYVALAILPVFLYARWNVAVKMWKDKPWPMMLGMLSFIMMLGVLSVAHMGKAPGFNMSAITSEYAGGTAEPVRQAFRSMKMFIGYSVLSFSVLTPLLFRWPGWKTHKEWHLTVIVFLATLLPYHGSTINMRYLLPIAPIFAWIVANNLTKLPRAAIFVLLGAFLLINGFTTAYYNSRAAYDWASPALRLPLPDNLRLNNGQRQADQSLEAIREQGLSGYTTLYFVDHYYGDGMWYVWQHEGLIPASMDVVYMRDLDWMMMKAHSIRHNVRRGLVYAKEMPRSDDLSPDIYVTRKGPRVYAVDFLHGVN